MVTSFSGGTPSKQKEEFWQGNIHWASPKDFVDFYLENTQDSISEEGKNSSSLRIVFDEAILVVVRSGILKHTLPITVPKIKTTINQDIKALIPKGKIHREYLASYLEVAGSRLLPLITKHSTTVQSVNTDEFEELLIPVPPPEIQEKLVQNLANARIKRKEKLAQADKLLAEVDEFVQRELGLCVPKEESKLAYGLSSRELIGRYDPHFHQPRFKKLENIINTIHHRKLGDLVSFSSQKWSPETAVEETFSYIEISGVNLQTGEITPNEIVVSEAPSRARMVVQKDDILVSLTRPHRGAVALVEPEYDNCIASTGFAVLREIKDTQINRLYLWCVLRTQICLQQMLQRSSGGSYPAITEEELKNILIPIPEESVQEKIANEMLLRQRQAKALRQEAEYDWAAAKAQFEAALLG